MSQIGVKDKGLKSSSLSHDGGGSSVHASMIDITCPTPHLGLTLRRAERNIPLVPTEAAVRMEIVN